MLQDCICRLSTHYDLEVANEYMDVSPGIDEELHHQENQQRVMPLEGTRTNAC